MSGNPNNGASTSVAGSGWPEQQESLSFPRIIDLTLTLRPGMRGVACEPKFNFREHGWNAQTLHLYSHCGTHMDAPTHSEAGDRTIDEVPLAQCMGMAWLVKLDGIAPRALITVADLGGIATRFAPGESLILRTGWSSFVDEAKWRDELPRVGPELARWCVEHCVKLLGVEPPSVADVDHLPELIGIHRTLLGGGVLIVEGLTNLEEIEQEKVFFAALPLKPLRGDGSPVRAFAVEGGLFDIMKMLGSNR
ncbi:MAG: cyclase family protein [Syntrophales bacterium]|nr:cyclase family protein [Syntrophales bacterium]